MTKSPIRKIAERIAGSVKPERPVLVGIDGGAGSGKTTFAGWLAKHLRGQAVPITTVPTDRIYRPVAEGWTGTIEEMPIGYDLDWERLRDEVLLPLKERRSARFQLYDWSEDRLGEWMEVEAAGVVIIDGVFALRNELADHYDLRIWLSCPIDIRIGRLLTRGDTAQEEIDAWLPVEARYHAAYRPEQSADLVVDSSTGMSAEDESRGFRISTWSPPPSVP